MFKCRENPDGSGAHSAEFLRVLCSYGTSPVEVSVVRWCSVCGAVVIDTDYDNRTKPGGIMSMRFPNYERKSMG